MNAANGGARIKIVRRRLADGTVKEYRYDLGAKARLRYAIERRGGIHRLAAEYYTSPDYLRLSDSWRLMFRWYVGILERELGWMTLDDLQNRRARGEFYRLRDELQRTPNKADKLMSVLRRLLSFGYERNILDANHALKMKPLETGGATRADRVWTPEHEAALLRVASPAVSQLFRFLLYSTARLGDACNMCAAAYDGRWLRFTPSKTRRSTGARVMLPAYVLPPLHELLAELPRPTEYLLCTDQGHPWIPRHAWGTMRRAMQDAGIGGEDLHAHDIRGTGITRMFEAGATEAEVAAISGHTLVVRSQLRAYVARSGDLAVNAYTKWARAMGYGATTLQLVEKTTFASREKTHS